ncbi:hypothetical protein [Stenotrophomonas maltophilia]|uniref:hypothetical protein n=1 Tax=Stenotrophomonas maltophilia TaxID=40324 RepID=UPI00115F2CC0|nr:hypothetical protein [Stenotrophomonas maltophilia]
MDRFKRIVLAMAAQLLAFGVQAQVHSFETYGRELARSESITALPAGFGQFGERIDFYSGAVSFHKTVVELPGNNALRVAADYEYTVQEKLGWPPKYALRRAEPFIMGIHSTELGWMVGSPNAYTGRRCSDPRRRGVAEVVRSSKPPIDNFLPEDYWDGNSLVGTEGGGIIRRLDQGEPSIPNVDVRWATNGGWRFSCYQLADGSDGFVGHGPDGNRYYFGRPERDEETLQIMSNFQQSDTWLDVSLYRMRLTRVEDRFGNWVNYSSSQITASDGRSITFSGTDGSVIEAGGRQWRLQGGVLTNPDGSTWSIGSVGGIAARPDGGGDRPVWKSLADPDGLQRAADGERQAGVQCERELRSGATPAGLFTGDLLLPSIPDGREILGAPALCRWHLTGVAFDAGCGGATADSFHRLRTAQRLLSAGSGAGAGRGLHVKFAGDAHDGSHWL